MNQRKPSNKNQPPEAEIRQQAENSTLGGGMQANQGDKNIQNQGNNNWLGNTWNIFFSHKNNHKLANSRDRIQQILLQQVSTEVESRINSSLHNRVYVVLETEQNPSQVECPWDIEVKVGNKAKVRLKDTEVITVFDQPDIAGRLLILGQPGAGKTTMLVKLAAELIIRANEHPKHPIPVIFSLSSWKKDNQSIKDWLVEQLKEKYRVRKDIAKQWVDNQEIIPLLDGLDEIAAERQEQCVRKINDFLQSQWSNPLVICSRTQEYQYYATLLQLNNSLELCPFTQEQIYQYLQKTDNLQLWSSISHDPDLSQLAKTPLLLNIIIFSFEEISQETWQQFKSYKKRLSYLLDSYINRMLKCPYKGVQPKQENTRYWLSWLAQKLIEDNTTEFLIEKMQPYWLKNKNQKLIYSLSAWGVMGGLTCGLLSGIVLGAIDGLIKWLIFGLIDGLIFGLIIGLIFGLDSRVIDNKFETSEITNIHLKNSKNTVFNFIVVGLYFGLFLGLVLGLFSWQLSGEIDGLFYFLNFCPFLVLFLMLVIRLIMGLFPGQFKPLSPKEIKEINLAVIKDKIEPVEKLKFSWKKFWNVLISWPIVMQLVVQVVLQIYGLSSGLGLSKGAISNMLNAIVFPLIGSLICGISGIEIEKRTFPNQGIKQSIINTIILIVITLPFTTILFFIILPIYLNNDNLAGYLGHVINSVIFGLILGIFIGIVRSGTPAIKHLLLRTVLWANGYIPWNYANFLNYCTNRLFLQRVGGSYRFINKLLQDHFAQIELKRN